ncbi:outer membrane protein TolC [Neolewinella xylanilytica]|uniref:Outer membrane protein TolC n=1 Tax=Neolewinella xylanilytica TaxID=1514080 RepID=A0A2S6I510_9BACT|nr:TolC family protein [Neolewinella xylanilytica]PPK86235.1 outer membrane protein TolC [Neolewinella xylanilytica]
MTAFPQLLLTFLLLGYSGWVAGQADYTLEECIAYALEEQPELKAQREELRLTGLDNQIAVSSWFPELFVSGDLQHYFQRPVSIFPDFENPESGQTTEVEVGTVNSSNLSVGARQTIYNPTVAAALRRQGPLLEATRLGIEAVEIQVRETVSRAFYNVVRARERLALLQADVERQERALADALLLFEEGLNDKVDYKRATITLNRTRLELQNTLIEVGSRLAELKEAMGYPAERNLDLGYDIDRIRLEVFADTVTVLQPNRRVEFRQLLARDRLVALEATFYRQAWLPDFYLGGTYNLTWQSNELVNLYDRVFPNSLASLNVSIPLFTGGRRFRQIERQAVLRDQLQFDLRALEDEVELQYRLARNNFDQAANAYAIARENVELAREIYEVVDLQYREGITNFLSVIIAENDLQEARLAVVNSLLDGAVARVGLRFAAGTL